MALATIFDPIRKKHVALTPEEHVRQQVIQYLIQVKKYPKGWITVERSLCAGGRKRRYDVVVFDKETRPFVLVECKAPHIPLLDNDSLLTQILAYHLIVQAPYLLLTNGVDFLCFERREHSFQRIATLPNWDHA